MDKKQVANKNRRRGKQNERALAKRLKARRVGILGKWDIENELFIGECKSRKKFIAEKWMEQIERAKRQDSRIAIVIVHIQGQHRKHDFVLMRMQDFEDLLGKIKHKEEIT